MSESQRITEALHAIHDACLGMVVDEGGFKLLDFNGKDEGRVWYDDEARAFLKAVDDATERIAAACLNYGG